MSVKVEYNSTCSVKETLETNVPASSQPVIKHDAFNTQLTLDADTEDVPVNLVACFDATISGGVYNIDLTSMPGTNNLTVDGTGKRVAICKFIAPVDNNDEISITDSVTNGHDLFGTTFTINIAPGQELMFFGAEWSPAITSVAKVLRLTGDTGDVLECMFVIGNIGSS